MNKKGFTLVELMVVVAVIATLGTVGFFGLKTAIKSARDTQRVGILHGLRHYLVSYQIDKSVYPYSSSPSTTNFRFLMAQLATYLSGNNPVDPGCGGSAMPYSSAQTDGTSGDWIPCGTNSPGYAYSLSDGIHYVLTLRKESGGTIYINADYEGSSPPIHGECQGNLTCLQVWGAGPGCSTDSDCYHFICQGMACGKVSISTSGTACSGDGHGACYFLGCNSASPYSCNLKSTCASPPCSDTCTGDSQCSHAICQGTSCAVASILTNGTACSGDGAGVCYHYNCSGYLQCGGPKAGGPGSCNPSDCFGTSCDCNTSTCVRNQSNDVTKYCSEGSSCTCPPPPDPCAGGASCN